MTFWFQSIFWMSRIYDPQVKSIPIYDLYNIKRRNYEPLKVS